MAQKFLGRPVSLISPRKISDMHAHAHTSNKFLYSVHVDKIFTQPDQIELILLVLSNKFLINGYKHSGTLFLRSSYHYLFKNTAHVRGICKFDPNCICVCICICVFVYLYCVFACQRLGNIVFEVLVPFPFQKYSTCWVYLQI